MQTTNLTGGYVATLYEAAIRQGWQRGRGHGRLLRSLRACDVLFDPALANTSKPEAPFDRQCSEKSAPFGPGHAPIGDEGVSTSHSRSRGLASFQGRG